MVQIHPSLPTTNTDNSRVLVVTNPLQSVSAYLQLARRLRFHRILFGFDLLVIGKMDADVDRFQGRPKSGRFDFQGHVVGEDSRPSFPI